MLDILVYIILLLLIFRKDKKKSITKTIEQVDKMSGREFEIYLYTLFCTLGYKVILHKGVADYGIDLILHKKNYKIAVQAKRYSNKVNLKAIQEAHAGKDFYKCNECIVITNSYFHKSAIELAKSVNCKLIDRNKLIQLSSSNKLKNKYYLIPYTIIYLLLFYFYKIILSIMKITY